MPHGAALPHRAMAQRRVGPDPNPVSMRVDAALKRACCVANGWRRRLVDARLRSKAINLLGTLRERTGPCVCNDYASNLDRAGACHHPLGSRGRMSVADQLSHHFGREAMRQHHRLGATVGGGAGEQRECTTALRDALERRRRRYAIGRLTGHDVILCQQHRRTV
jgi:hypothetical protein